jgi:branched-chain amino acid transport system substrate-binding protein
MTSISTAGSQQSFRASTDAYSDNLRVQELTRAAGFATAACLLFTIGCTHGARAPNPATTIKIGVDLPLTGPEAAAAVPTLNGVLFYVKRHPKLDGFTVVVVARDDAAGGQPSPPLGVEDVHAFVADAHMLAMVGPFDSSVARSEIPIANQGQLAMVSPAGGNRCLTKEPFLPAALNPARVAITCAAAGVPTPSALRPVSPNNYFRLSTTDDLQGPAAADYAFGTLHLLRVAVISDDEAYGQALAAGFRARFNRLGGSIVSHVDYSPSGGVDLTSFMEKAKQDGARGIYFGGAAANKGCVLRAQMASVFGAGAAAPMLGGDGIAEDPACIRDAGANSVGIFATVPAVDPDQANSAQPVIAAFKASYKNASDYGAYTIAAYDAAGVLYDALDRAIKGNAGKLPARSQVLTQVASTTAYQGAMGMFGFDTAGDTTLRVVSIFEPAGSDPAAPWKWIRTIDYSGALPY